MTFYKLVAICCILVVLRDYNQCLPLEVSSTLNEHTTLQAAFLESIVPMAMLC